MPPRAGARLMPPDAFTTRCQGTAVDGASACSAYPTCRACPGIPASLAIWPYVATRPRGTRRTTA